MGEEVKKELEPSNSKIFLNPEFNNRKPTYY